MSSNFWEMIVSDRVLVNIQAVEIIRRCSSRDIFRAILGRLALLLSIAHAVNSNKGSLVIVGKFVKEPEKVISNDQTVSIVRLDIAMVTADLNEVVAESRFYLHITNLTGRIVGVSNSI